MPVPPENGTANIEFNNLNYKVVQEINVIQVGEKGDWNKIGSRKPTSYFIFLVANSVALSVPWLMALF